MKKLKNNYKFNYDNFSFIGKVDIKEESLIIERENNLFLTIDLESFKNEFNNNFKELIMYLCDDNFSNYNEIINLLYYNLEK